MLRWHLSVSGIVSKVQFNIIKIFYYSFIIGPTCPNNFEMNIGEEDGRSCYGIIAETSSSISKDALQVQNPNIYILYLIIMQ